MAGTVGRYRKPDGREEIRIHFPEWELADGRVARNVSVFPHVCGTCAGGDHTHVEINDTREPIEILERGAVTFSDKHAAVIESLIIAKLAVDALTLKLMRYVKA